jgi:chromosome partition protein MukF
LPDAPTAMTGPELGRLLTRLHGSEVALSVGTFAVCHLVTLRFRGEAAGTSAFTEDELLETMAEVHAFLDPGGDHSRLRATTALRHLREQRLITRIDGAGLTRSGRFALSRLGVAIAEYFGSDERLDTESLVILTQGLRGQLVSARENAASAASAEAWRFGVSGPLGVTGRDLVAGIERRQRGLDAAQERIRERIANLLRDDWFRAIETCEALLDETAETLSELNAVLLRETTELHGILQDIEQLGRDAGEVGADTVAAAEALSEQIDRVAGWGASRQRAWSDYYQYVQRFLRDVVRLDPGRALSQRLRDHIRTYLDRPWRLTVAASLPVPQPRAPEAMIERPAVTRPAGAGDVPIETVDSLPQGLDLEGEVQKLLQLKPSNLAAVLARLVDILPPDDLYRDLGRATAAVAARVRLAPPSSQALWTGIGAGLEVEDWGLAEGAGARAEGSVPPKERAPSGPPTPENRVPSGPTTPAPRRGGTGGRR